MGRTLNDLISNQILGAREGEDDLPTDVTPEQKSTQPDDSHLGLVGEAEKLASALEFVGRTGVANILVKEASDHGLGNVGTNDGAAKKGKSGAQVPHNKDSSPMKEPGYGLMPNNEGQKPGSGKEVDTSGKQQGTHHSALKSNESAISYDKKEKSKQVSSSLQSVLDAKPFADGTLKRELSGAGGKGDKNIHSKAASDQLAAARAELARRAAAAQQESN